MLWPILGGLVCGSVGALIAWNAAMGDPQVTDGPERFVGMVAAIGLVGGYYVTGWLTRGGSTTRHGMTLSYKRIEATATGYREIKTLTVEDVLAGLRASGYEPKAKGCDELGTVRRDIDPSTALAGANFAITDRAVKGWIRIQLAPPPDGSARAMGLVESWTERGDSASELALFAVRVLDGLVGDLTASYDDSALSGDPAKLFVAALGDKPKHR